MKRFVFSLPLPAALLLLVLVCTGCAGRGNVNAENKSEPEKATTDADIVAAERLRLLNEFDVLLTESEPPATADFCTAHDWDDKLVNFLIRASYTKVDMYALAGRQVIKQEYRRRHLAVGRAAAMHLKRYPGRSLPNCSSIDPMYMIGDIYVIEDELPESEKSIKRPVLIGILTAEARDKISQLRATSWEEKDRARLYFQLVTGRYDLTAKELRRIGLNNNEVRGLLASLKKSAN